jgi:hypothetical protein
MKKTLSLCAGTLLCVVLLAPAVRATGLNLGWGAFCPTNVGSVVNVNDPCDGSVATPYLLVGSVVAPSPAPTHVDAEEWYIDFQENAVALSDYWKLEDENQPGQTNLAGCRGFNSVTGNVGSLVAGIANINFPGAFTGCTKFWGTGPFGGVNYGVLVPDAYPGIVDPRRARLIGHYAISPDKPMIAGTQYLMMAVSLDTNHQNGIDPNYPAPTYQCAGCADGVCIVFNQMTIFQTAGTPGGDYLVTDQDQRRTVTWQGGGFDCTTVPVKRATWGQIKSLYR